jgi:phosphatidylinositol 4-kinase
MDQVQKLAPHQAPAAEIYALKGKIARVIEEIRNKQSALTVQDLRRLVFRCTAVLIAIPKVTLTSYFSKFNSDLPVVRL